MPRKNVKAIIARPRPRWSHENKSCAMQFSAEPIYTFWQAGSNVVPAATSQGIRTVGNWTITVPVSTDKNVYWALVYVPQGTTVNNLFATSGGAEGSLYEPNQYVLASGIADGNAGPIRVRSKMKRTLHSGDFISLIIASQDQNIANTYNLGLVSYSIKYN